MKKLVLALMLSGALGSVTVLAQEQKGMLMGEGMMGMKSRMGEMQKGMGGMMKQMSERIKMGTKKTQ